MTGAVGSGDSVRVFVAQRLRCFREAFRESLVSCLACNLHNSLAPTRATLRSVYPKSVAQPSSAVESPAKRPARVPVPHRKHYANYLRNATLGSVRQLVGRVFCAPCQVVHRCFGRFLGVSVFGLTPAIHVLNPWGNCRTEHSQGQGQRPTPLEHGPNKATTLKGSNENDAQSELLDRA